MPALAISALLVTGTSAPAIAQDAPSGEDLFVVTTGTQSITEGIAAQAALDADYREEAVALTGSWLTTLESGGTVEGLAGLSVATMSWSGQNDAVQKLHDDLVTGDLPVTRPFSSAASTPDEEGGGDVSTMEVNPQNPNSYDVRGQAGIGFWNGMQLITAGAFCGGMGCSETDRLTSTVTVDPGARTSRVSATNNYFPNEGNFGERHFELWAINSGQYVGNSDTGYLPPNSEDYISSFRPLNNSVLTTAVTQWVEVLPYNRYVADGAKTSDALCAADDDNACYY